MCKSGQTREVELLIPEDLSYTGYARFKPAAIDECIAPIVQALQRADINMRHSCCGHGKGEGDIHLQDGRILLVLSKEVSDVYMRHRENGNSVQQHILSWVEGQEAREDVPEDSSGCQESDS